MGVVGNLREWGVQRACDMLRVPKTEAQLEFTKLKLLELSKKVQLGDISIKPHSAEGA